MILFKKTDKSQVLSLSALYTHFQFLCSCFWVDICKTCYCFSNIYIFRDDSSLRWGLWIFKSSMLHYFLPIIFLSLRFSLCFASSSSCRLCHGCSLRLELKRLWSAVVATDVCFEGFWESSRVMLCYGCLLFFIYTTNRFCIDSLCLLYSF